MEFNTVSALYQIMTNTVFYYELVTAVTQVELSRISFYDLELEI